MRQAIQAFAILTVLAFVLPAALAGAGRSESVTWYPTPGIAGCNSGILPGTNAACFKIRPGERSVEVQMTFNPGTQQTTSVEFHGASGYINGWWVCGDHFYGSMPEGTIYVKVFFWTVTPASSHAPCGVSSVPSGGKVTATFY